MSKNVYGIKLLSIGYCKIIVKYKKCLYLRKVVFLKVNIM